jgi:tetratricopeptide (TPR) repeat protein
MALHVGHDRRPEVRVLLEAQMASLGPGEDPVRNRWSIAADYMGGLQAANGNYAKAVHCYQKALEVKPDNVVALSHLAMALLASGEPGLAVQTLSHAIGLRPAKAVLHFQMAQVLARLGRVPEAIRALEEGIVYAPADPSAKGMLEYLKGL